MSGSPASAQPDSKHSITDGDVVRYPGWIPLETGDAAVWLHLPAHGRVRQTVLICPPLGFEGVHSHRTVARLADRLAKSGFAAMRLDLPGTGTSSGDETVPGLFDAWQASVRAACELLDRAAPGAPRSMIGIRAGTLLTGLEAIQNPCAGWVAWAPIARGRRYGRELRALHGVSAREDDIVGFVEAGGFRFSQETLDSLAEVDLLDTPAPFADAALLIHPIEQPANPKLQQALEKLGTPTTVVEHSGFPEMMAEPHYTVVPDESVEAIVQWLQPLASTEEIAVRDEVLESLTQIRTGGSTTDETEEMVVVPASDGASLFAVLVTPAADEDARGRVVLVTNAGSVHHIGPNRLYVEMARALASAGVSTLRLDLRNLGDSLIGAPDDENHPYPETASADIEAAVTWLEERGFEDVVLAGLCSGAHAAFRAGVAIEGHSISRVVVVNPLTFDFRAGMSLETPPSYKTEREAKYYQRAALNPENWKRLLTGQSETLKILSFVLRRVSQRMARPVRSMLFRIKLRQPTQLEADLQQMAARGRRPSFVFASTDPGLDILLKEARPVVHALQNKDALTVDTVSGADHTFSKSVDRRRAIQRVVSQMRGPSSLSLERVKGAPDDLWKSLEPVWSELLQSTGDTSAYLSLRWMSRCIRHSPRGVSHMGLIWRTASDEPVACAVTTVAPGNVGPVRVWRASLNCSGARDLGCEHNDVLVLDRYRAEVTRSLAEVLAEFEVDGVRLTGVRDRLFEGMMQAWGEPKWSGFRSEAPFVSLDELRESDQPYESVLSSNTRRQVRRSERLYSEQFGAVEGRPAQSTAEALTWFDEMLRLHDARWDALGEDTGFLPEARAFHRELVAEPEQTDYTGLHTVLYRLQAGGETIAILHYLVVDGAVHFHQSGINYQDDNRLKPGLVAHVHAIEHFMAEGASVYDFLGGEPRAVRYKRSLSTDAGVLYWATIARDTPRMRVINAARALRRVVRDDS